MLFPIKIDTACSKFEITNNNSMSLSETIKCDEGTMKTLLKQKWHEVSGSKQ